LQFFALIFATFNAVIGGVPWEAQLYGVGHRITQERGAVPCYFLRRWKCGHWDFVTTCRVWFWFGMCVMNDYNVSCVPTQHKTLTWYARFKYICLYVRFGNVCTRGQIRIISYG